ncbi:hypothetical protein D049_1929B, partial [Vibrio parahaemolyticus VPTS-2010]
SDIKKEAGVLRSCPRVIRSTMLANITLKLAHFRVFFRTQKKHVF